MRISRIRMMTIIRLLRILIITMPCNQLLYHNVILDCPTLTRVIRFILILLYILDVAFNNIISGGK